MGITFWAANDNLIWGRKRWKRGNPRYGAISDFGSYWIRTRRHSVMALVNANDFIHSRKPWNRDWRWKRVWI